MKFPLGWGNSVAVRNAFLSTYNHNDVLFSWRDLEEFNYPEHEGDKEVIEITRSVIKRQTGSDYKYILLTNGATGGVTIALRAYRDMECDVCFTRGAPYYVRYPNMIRASGLYHVSSDYQHSRDPGSEVVLLDTPSNPCGLIDNPFENMTIAGIDPYVVLDGVYHNNVYTPGNLKLPKSDVLVGSYSKLLGLNGLRIGWIATNNINMYIILKDLVTSEYSGLGTASSVLLKNILQGLDWEDFEKYARKCLDHNREEWSKLEKYFEGKPVSELGMFYYAKVDPACKKLLEKADVEWTLGSAMGTNDSYGRFNIGQDQNLIRDAVKTIIKMDTIK